MRSILGPQHIADVAVAVQADRCMASVKATIDPGERLLSHGLPCLQQIGWDEICVQQERARVMAESLRRQRVANLEFLSSADGVDAADEAPDPFQRPFIAELGRAAAAAWIDGDAEVAEVQRMRGRDDRDLAAGELVREGVLL